MLLTIERIHNSLEKQQTPKPQSAGCNWWEDAMVVSPVESISHGSISYKPIKKKRMTDSWTLKN